MSAYFCEECKRVCHAHCQGYIDVGNDRGVCENCGAKMQEEAHSELMEHWDLTAPASEYTDENRRAMAHGLYTMPLADLLVRLRDLRGETS